MTRWCYMLVNECVPRALMNTITGTQHELYSNCTLTYPPKRRMYASVNGDSIGSNNGLSPIRHQAIIWANAGLLSIVSLGQISLKFRSECYKNNSRKCIWKYLLRNCGHFVQGEMSYKNHTHGLHLLCVVVVSNRDDLTLTLGVRIRVRLHWYKAIIIAPIPVT